MSKEYQGFKIKSVANEKATIEIYGDIGGWDWDTYQSINTIEILRKELNRLSELKVSKIDVLINSYGGDVNHGLAIYDALKDHPAEVTTYINGMCASAATIIFCAGNIRKISKNALFLIHKCSSVAWGNENELNAALEAQKAVNDRMVSIYVENSTTNEADIIELMNVNNGNGKWINPTEVSKMGFAEVYNETSVAAFKISKEIFAKAKLPELPEEYKNLIQDDDKPLSQTIKDFIVDLFNSQSNKNNNQQSEVPMKKLFAVFPLLCAVLALQNKEEEFDETKGRVLSNDEMKLVEAQISELNALKAEKTAWEAEKTTLNGKVTSLTTERDDFKAKYENTPAFKGQGTGDDKDTDSYAAKQKENPMYATMKEEYGME